MGAVSQLLVLIAFVVVDPDPPPKSVSAMYGLAAPPPQLIDTAPLVPPGGAAGVGEGSGRRRSDRGRALAARRGRTIDVVAGGSCCHVPVDQDGPGRKTDRLDVGWYRQACRLRRVRARGDPNTTQHRTYHLKFVHSLHPSRFPPSGRRRRQRGWDEPSRANPSFVTFVISWWMV